MKGKVCLITGANAGIGRATAEELARRGAVVVMVARDQGRGEKAREEIVQATGNRQVELLLADLSSQAQIRGLAEEFRARYDRLDVLINNAAVFTRERRTTEDRIELQFATNHLAPLLLTNLLLDLLRKSAPARVITVSSEAHQRTSMNWKDLQGERGYSGLKAYSQSKLANVLFTKELARRLEGTGVTANALHPGVIGTNLLLGGFGPLRLLGPLFKLFLKDPEQGARTSVYLAASLEIEGVSGGYFKDEKRAAASPQAEDPEAARRLWEISAELTGLVDSASAA